MAGRNFTEVFWEIARSSFCLPLFLTDYPKSLSIFIQTRHYQHDDPLIIFHLVPKFRYRVPKDMDTYTVPEDMDFLVKCMLVGVKTSNSTKEALLRFKLWCLFIQIVKNMSFLSLKQRTLGLYRNNPSPIHQSAML
jgi:hypothetical protein